MQTSLLKRLNPLNKDARVSVAILVLLLAAASVSPSAYRYRPREDTALKKVFRTMQKRGLNREAAAGQTAGYYEGILDHAGDVTRVGGASWFDWRFWFRERAERAARNAEFMRPRSDYLAFDLHPNVNVPDQDDRRRVVTNSLGMVDREYSPKPTDETWRIALIGDSVSQGQGVHFGMSFEARLEDALNERFKGIVHDRYEILNFSVRGYQITQLVEVGLHRVPPFSPDVYVLALTERSVFTQWADHLASLVRNNVDLKYGLLKKVVREAGLTSDMAAPLINAKLAPHRQSILRWALGEIQRQAQRGGAALVVLLVPTSDDPEMQIEQFEPAGHLLADMSILTVDLLETFAYLDDLAPVRVSAADRHPNEEGHRMLFEALLGKIESDVRLREVFTGARGRSSSASVAQAVQRD